ncbi:MAG TPA: Nif3-like dinuclear metal center hexameric protein [Feifaniaceae bacterium]|nr:Nif3-like dinuclear metal center hexameric protein [Feifaniaceae bacterium]
MTVRQIADAIIRKTGVPPLPEGQTCDRLMAGSWEQEVTGIATTFMATVDVIARAVAAGANLIITHEPTWYTGDDQTDWLEEDEVYLRKKTLIEQTGMAIWRFHDHMHFSGEDGIFRGFDRETGWADYRMAPPQTDTAGFGVSGRFDGCYEIPQTTLKELCEFFRRVLSMEVVQIVGDPEMRVSRVGVLPGGASLGLGTEQMPMQLMRARNADVIVCGDIKEWTLPAYVRDATQLGLNRAILVLGHERSEESGMKYLGEWLEDIVAGTPVVFIDAEEPFLYV